ncbi:MAG: catalase [Flavobacteriales bacterium]|jgi:catalase|uniref:catalase n=1 Tax=Candidatus Kaistella beijingensis TaxID=2820270 RepID=UPI0019EE4940|nr:catalase [Candidatus Kaistella beijingensis]MBE2272801.1 catalase [Flavobacteriales bacterium]UBB89215.1 catalase [Candidatus Kaistella beijingensis]HQD44291.1 catalase [Kaistella sp.]
MSDKKLTNSAGIPYFDHQDSQTVGARGPVLLQDFILQENLAHFVRERIPERIVHAKGTGAYGTFTVTHDISKYTKAKLFSKVGNSCKMFARFSTVGGEKGSADTERDPRGFALKFYTEDGNWDLVGNNTPVFFIKDAKKFPDFIHTQKRVPKTNLKSATMMWDFWSLNPESLHQVLILMSDRGTPHGYRHMHGFGSHTFSMINAANERVWVKFHLKTKQGIKNFSHDEAVKMKGENPDFAQEDLVDAIENGNFPKWTMYIQVMTEEQAKEFRWNPFDVTKVWFQDEFPLIEVGEMELNEIPVNYFAHVEQSTFSPSNLVNGISFSPDKMLQGRLFSYPDAHRYRVGVNSHLLEVNRCPFATNNSQRDGFMADSSHYKDAPNYFPNSFDDIKADESYKNFEYDLDSTRVGNFNRNENDDDHYTQPGLLYTKALNQKDRENLVYNITQSMKGISGPKREEIINRQLCHFFRANIELGMKIAMSLQINIDANMMNHSKS